MSPISVGLAGFGTGGRLFHAPFLHADPSYSLDFVYERTRDQARSLYPKVQRVESFEKLLATSCDLIVIALPNALHFSCVKSALEAGKHVLCDKPLCEHSREAMELFSLAKAKGLTLAVYQNRRFDSEIRTLQKLIDENTLGDLKDVSLTMERFQKQRNPKEWKNIPCQVTGIHYDLGIHLIDAAYSLFGMPQRVFCTLRTLHSWNSVPDGMDLTLFYNNDLRVHLRASQCAMLSSPCLIAHGTRGSYMKQACDKQERLLNQGLTPLSKEWIGESQDEWGKVKTLAEEAYSYPSVDGDYGEYYRRLAKNFPHGKPPVDAMEASQVLRILEGAILSDASQRMVDL